MDIRSRIKHLISFLLHGVHSPVFANISYLSPNERLKGCKIIVTGGSRGLGFAMAKKFVEEGAKVLIIGRHEEILKKSATLINCKYLVGDMQEVASYKNIISEADELLDGANCLVNNAGISLHEKDFFHVSEKSFNAQINTNLKSGVFFTQEFIRKVLERESAANILFISSEVGELADNRPYGWTKASMNSLVKGLASNFSSKGIRVNAISPGITCSSMTGLDSKGDLYISTNATLRAYLPEEIAEIATFILSNCSSCISGQIILCNNGKTIYSREKIEKYG